MIPEKGKSWIVKVSVLAAVLALAIPAFSDHGDRGGGGRDNGGQKDDSNASPAQAPRESQSAAPAPARPSRSAGHNRAAVVSSSRGQKAASQNHYSIHLGRPAQQPGGQGSGNAGHPSVSVERPAREVSSSGGSAVYHHHAAPTKAQRVQLKKLGIKSVPRAIGERADILDTDRAHSAFKMPVTGMNGARLSQHVIEARHFADPVVRAQMGRVMGAPFMNEITVLNRDENERGRYFWHRHDGFDYCHHIDQWGYTWYGWYVGEQCFWTRYFSNHWWFYDSAYDRWCYWNSGNWWWQDPYHVGDVYVYTDTAYIPASEEPQGVTSTEPANATAFRSPDDSRMVKLMPITSDAFLYDTAIPPSFNPVYLASKVQTVRFSDTSNGAPMMIVLKLADGTEDQFDDRGHPLNFREVVPEMEK